MFPSPWERTGKAELTDLDIIITAAHHKESTQSFIGYLKAL
jgi:hypothetical protein